MTGNECFAAAMNLLNEQEEGYHYYQQFALGCLNQLLANCLREINALRTAQQMEPLRIPPKLDLLDAEIPADEAMLRECFPYGLAALLICDEDKNRFNWLGSEFAARLDYHCPASQFAIKELY